MTEDVESTAGAGTLATAAGPFLADIYARLHDVAVAELALQTTKAATEMEAFEQGYANFVVSTNYPGYNCWIASAEEAAGHPDRADAVLRNAGCYS